MNQQQQEIEELKEEIARLKEIVEPNGNVVDNYNLTRSERLSNFLRKRWKLLAYSMYLIVFSIIYLYVASSMFGGFDKLF